MPTTGSIHAGATALVKFYSNLQLFLLGIADRQKFKTVWNFEIKSVFYGHFISWKRLFCELLMKHKNWFHYILSYTHNESQG